MLDNLSCNYYKLHVFEVWGGTFHLNLYDIYYSSINTLLPNFDVPREELKANGIIHMLITKM